MLRKNYCGYNNQSGVEVGDWRCQDDENIHIGWSVTDSLPGLDVKVPATYELK